MNKDRPIDQMNSAGLGGVKYNRQLEGVMREKNNCPQFYITPL
jgi:hypothetical protein